MLAPAILFCLLSLSDAAWKSDQDQLSTENQLEPLSDPKNSSNLADVEAAVRAERRNLDSGLQQKVFNKKKNPNPTPAPTPEPIYTAKYWLNDLDANSGDFVWPEESIIPGCKVVNTYIYSNILKSP